MTEYEHPYIKSFDAAYDNSNNMLSNRHGRLRFRQILKRQLRANGFLSEANRMRCFAI